MGKIASFSFISPVISLRDLAHDRSYGINIANPKVAITPAQDRAKYLMQHWPFEIERSRQQSNQDWR
jgi:hypothetical protein